MPAAISRPAGLSLSTPLHPGSRILMVVVATGLALAAVEVGIRFVPPDLSVLQRIIRLVDEPIVYHLQPDVEMPFDGLFETLPESVIWQTNEQGFRATSGYTDRSDRRRVAAFGDSETFGWSVAIEDSLPAQLEKWLPDTEVLNFGVPGYNTTNVALLMAELVPRYAPAVVVYLFNKNDFDPQIRVDGTFFRSHLLGRIRFLWQITVTREERRQIRHSRQRAQIAAQDLDRMAAVVSQSNALLVVPFMKARSWDRLQAEFDGESAFMAGVAAGWIRVLNAEPVLDEFTTLDDHLSPAAYAALAALLCTHSPVCPEGSIAVSAGF